MQFLPVLYQHTILHDDVVATADELMNLHIAWLVVERETETDVEHVTSRYRCGMVGVGALKPQDSFTIRNYRQYPGIKHRLNYTLFCTVRLPTEFPTSRPQ